MKKVLVIGSRGMLGQELVVSLQKEYEVISWSSEDLNITKKDTVLRKIKDAKPDMVINAAAFNDVDGAEINKGLAQISIQANSFAPQYLAEAANNNGAIFVHYTTDYVFDGKELSYKENSATSPISKHGKSKAEGEKKIEEVGGNWYIVRLSRLFGDPSQSIMGKKSFFQKILELSKTNKELRIIDDEISCFTYAHDLAESTRGLISGKYPRGIYHLANEGSASWYEGAKELFEIFGIYDVKLIPVSSDKFSRVTRIPKSSILINTKFPKLRHFRDAIEDWKVKVIEK